MTVEQLLKPRRKVIADWPENNSWSVGDILEFKVCEHGYYHEHWYGSQKTVWYENYAPRPKHSFDTYPHLFKKLDWHEERKAEDMPKYVKHNGEVYKIHHWDETATLGWSEESCKDIPVKYSMPATEQEYTQYLTTLKNQ